MWETRLGVERNECLEAAKGSWGRMEESTMGVGEASPTAEVILSFWAWVSLSSRASQFHTLVFLSAWGPQVSAALYLAPPVSTLHLTPRNQVLELPDIPSATMLCSAGTQTKSFLHTWQASHELRYIPRPRRMIFFFCLDKV